MQCFVISSYIALHDFLPSNITMSCRVVSCLSCGISTWFTWCSIWTTHFGQQLMIGNHFPFEFMTLGRR